MILSFFNGNVFVRREIEKIETQKIRYTYEFIGELSRRWWIPRELDLSLPCGPTATRVAPKHHQLPSFDNQPLDPQRDRPVVPVERRDRIAHPQVTRLPVRPEPGPVLARSRVTSRRTGASRVDSAVRRAAHRPVVSHSDTARGVREIGRVKLKVD